MLENYKKYRYCGINFRIYFFLKKEPYFMKKTGEETITPIKNMKIIQRNDFQNFTLDSVLLSDFVKINRKTKKILDIGTGCGIIALLLAQRSKARITGIELQKTMAEIAIRNIKINEFENQVKIINEDIQSFYS